MPKKKKTRKQKMISDTRHREYIEHPLHNIEINQLPQITRESKQNISQTVSLPEFSYLYSDLIKTTILTSSIIIAELLLRFIFVAQ